MKTALNHSDHFPINHMNKQPLELNDIIEHLQTLESLVRDTRVLLEPREDHDAMHWHERFEKLYDEEPGYFDDNHYTPNP